MKSTGYASLSALIAIAETGSFRKAAARLNLKPSTLSHGIRMLDAAHGRTTALPRHSHRFAYRSRASALPADSACL